MKNKFTPRHSLYWIGAVSLVDHPLSGIPVEIWDQILSLIPNSALHTTTLSLLSLFSLHPSALPISSSHLYRSISISTHSQLKPLLASLSAQPELVHLPRTFSLTAWRLLDNHLLINLINLVSTNLRAIDLRIGPLFGPDQLEELFLVPKPKLKVLSLRFNQNVSKRSYEPFLKGAYFDSTIDLLSTWPSSTPLRSLSFVQDPPPAILSEGIAQPIILFRFWCLTTFATSPLATALHNLRLRIPHRDLLPPLTRKSDITRPVCPGRTSFCLPASPLPSLRYLDLSNSYLTSVPLGLATLLRTYPSLQHLVLDRTHLIVPSRFEGDEERVRATVKLMGATIATTGLSRAIDATRMWRDFAKTVTDENKNRGGHQSQPLAPSSSMSTPPPSRRPTRPKKQGRSAFASGPMKQQLAIHSDPCLTRSFNEKLDQAVTYEILLPSKVVIVPPPPILKTLSCGTPAPPSARTVWAEAFLEGWSHGIEKYESGVEEKLTEWERNMQLWQKHQQEHDTRPRLMIFGLPSTPHPDDPVQAFFDTLGLREASAPSVAPATVSPPVFCTVPDCAAVGQVVWRPAGTDSVDLIRLGRLKIADQPSEPVRPLECAEDHVTNDSDERGDKEHPIGCGHLLGRKIWDSDYW